MQFFSWGMLRLQCVVFGFLAVAAFFLWGIPAWAQANSSIAQQFQTSTPGITPASLVSIERGNSSSVALSKATQADQLAGVVSSKPLIGLSDGSGVQVVTSGSTVALVSDINGNVTTGDKITASPISGVGMKATESTVIVGTAQAPLNGLEAETREITDASGKKQAVRIGLIPVQVGVVFYSPEGSKDSILVPPLLQTLANNISGRDVSPVRVLVAALILLLLLLSITVLLYSSVRSSIISIGRNPLSESAVRKSLAEVGLTIFSILVFSLGIIYLILTV